MFTILFLILTVFFSGAAILVKRKRSAVDIVETVIVFMMLFNVGIGCLFAAAGHALFGDRVAAGIGWPAGSPFQLEVAAANLAIGILGILSLRFRQNFWLATSIAYAVFLFGAAAVHIREIVARGNYAGYNSGAFLFVGDILIPLALLVLVVMDARWRR